jgi:hypothetical protein
MGSQLDDRVTGVQNLAGTRGFSLSQRIQMAFRGHPGIKQPECEAVGTYPFGVNFMDVFKRCVLVPYNFNRCSTMHFDKYEVFFPTNALFIRT